MKKSLILFQLLIALFVNAQEIDVKEAKDKINGVVNPVFTVIISSANESTIEKNWKNLMKSYDAKVSTKDNIFADNALIKGLSDNTVDVYAITQKTDAGVKLTIGVDMGGIFIASSTKPDEYKFMEKIIKEFAVQQAKSAVQELLDAAEKEQKKLNNSYNELIKKNENLHKNIEDYKSKISQAEKDIEENLKAQEEAKKAIELQAEAIEKIKKKLSEIK